MCSTSDNPELFSKYFDYLGSVEDHKLPDYKMLVQLFAAESRDDKLTYKDFSLLLVENEFNDDTNVCYQRESS